MYFVILFCQGGLRAPANMVFERMEALAAEAGAEEIHIRAPMQFSRATYLRSFQPDPWREVVAAQEAAAVYRQTGDLREACVCEHMVGQVQAEAGDSAAGEASLREALALTIRLAQPNLITSSYLHLASVLAARKEPSALLEAEDCLNKVLAVSGLSGGFRGWAHGIRAQILFGQERYEEAELEARKSIELSQIAPLRRLLALVTLVYVLLRRDRPEEALALGEEGLEQAESIGGTGYSELPVRLAAAEARYATGDLEGACAALHAANNELKRRTALIPESAARARYLTNIPEHARITALAGAWGLTDDNP
jgi:eukaryotic-like serine/threonine-protein kinase